MRSCPPSPLPLHPLISSCASTILLQAVRQREELASLRRLTLEMQARHPDVARAVEAAVQGEQAVQEERNRRSLELLSAKDAALKAAAVQVWGRGAGHVGREVQPV